MSHSPSLRRVRRNLPAIVLRNGDVPDLMPMPSVCLDVDATVRIPKPDGSILINYENYG